MRTLFKKLINKKYVIKYSDSLLKDQRLTKSVLNYSFQNREQLYLLTFNIPTTDRVEKTRVVKLIDLYQTQILRKVKASLETQYFYKRIKRLFCSSFSSGYIIKKNKGGFIVDLNGLICFMPSSFADMLNRKTRVFAGIFKEIQFFKDYTTSISFSKRDNNTYFNRITSRRQSFYFLKKLLRLFNYAVILRNVYSFNYRANIQMRHKVLRVLVINKKDFQQSFLKFTKEFLFVSQ